MFIIRLSTLFVGDPLVIVEGRSLCCCYVFIAGEMGKAVFVGGDIGLRLQLNPNQEGSVDRSLAWLANLSSAACYNCDYPPFDLLPFLSTLTFSIFLNLLA
jgi:hypothetical protein